MDIITYLHTQIKESIANDINSILRYHKRYKTGFHSIPRQIFCYIDFLGALVYGKNSTNNSVRYINKYLGLINPRYKEVSEIIYEMWRHGTVHEYDPKVLIEGKNRLGWLSGFSSKKKDKRAHLTCYKKTINNEEYFFLNLNMNQFVSDLYNSIDKLVDKLMQDDVLQNRLQKNLDKLNSPKKVKKRLNAQFSNIISTAYNLDDPKH